MVTNMTIRQILLLLALIAAILTASGFILEYGFHVLPCKMCWWQRYAHYALLAAALIGLAHPKLPKPALAAIIATSLGGLGIALWQFAAQHGWLPFPASCTSDATQTFASANDLLTALNQTKVVPCDQETFTLLGLSLAGWNIPAMFLTTFLAAMGLKSRT